MAAPIRFSVVIPVYNSATTLETLLGKLASELPNISSEYEVILVNDGSQDKSWEILQGLAQRYPWVQAI